VTHEMLALFLVFLGVMVIAGFAWMTYVAREIHCNTRALAALVYQESEKTRAALGRFGR
jgi:hypothetical protein